MTSRILKSTGQILLECLSVGIFFMIRRGLYIFVEDHWGKVSFSSHHIKGTCYQSDLLTCRCWPWSPGFSSACQVSLLPSNSFFPFSVLYSSKEVTSTATLMKWTVSYVSPPWGQSSYINYLKFFLLEMFLFFSIIYFFSHLFILVWTHGDLL